MFGEGGKALVLCLFFSRDLHGGKDEMTQEVALETHSTSVVGIVVDTTGATMAMGGLMLLP